MGVKTRKLGNIDNQLIEWQSSIFVGDGSTGLTAVAGRGYFIDTENGSVTVTLPSDTDGAVNIGDQVAFKDFNRTFGTNNLSFATNKFDGVGGQTPSFSTDGQSIHLIYAGNTNGWQLIGDDTVTALGAEYIAATGGTITTSGNFKIHTFTGDGCFSVSGAGNAAGSNSVDYLVVGGGGGGGYCMGGGGGAGGYRESPGSTTCYTASPLGASPAAALPVSVQDYPVSVGGGGAGATSGPSTGTNGSVSSFQTITSAGGGGGGTRPGAVNGANGASGGGGSNDCGCGGTGNTPPVSPPQGKNGGSYSPGFNNSSGGGGAKCAGSDGAGPTPAPQMGPGGDGSPSEISGSAVTRAGGGGGGGYPPQSHKAGVGGAGGGGYGGGTNTTIPICNVAAADGSANTGGGGGGGKHSATPNPGNGGTGGKGVVIIRYKFQN